MDKTSKRIKKARGSKNKEHWIRVYERTLDLYRKEYNQFKNSMKCSNCGSQPPGYICEKCGWDNSNQYADGSELRKQATKFIKRSLDIVTNISLLDEECGLKWISRYQTIIDKLAVKKSDIDIDVLDISIDVKDIVKVDDNLERGSD